MDRNFRWSPTTMQLLTHGSSFFTASSIGTGAMFSPPAVIKISTKIDPQFYKLLFIPTNLQNDINPH